MNVLFFFENFFFQLQFILLFLFFFNLVSLYFILFNFLFFILFFSFFLGYFNLDLFMIFLLLVEFVVFFVILMFYFFLFVYDAKIKLTKNQLIFFVFAFLMCFFNFSNFSETWFFLNFWNDYYELFNNLVSNDFFLLYLSFYEYYIFEYIIFGILLVIVSLNCVLLFNFFKIIKLPSYFFFLNYKSYFFKSIVYFLRTQNLFKQGSFVLFLKNFKKKINQYDKKKNMISSSK